MPRSYFKTTFSVTLSEAKGLKYLKKTRLFASHRMTIFFWFPSSCFAQKPAVLMQAGFRQAELGAKGAFPSRSLGTRGKKEDGERRLNLKELACGAGLRARQLEAARDGHPTRE